MGNKALEYFENLKGKKISLIGLGVSHRPLVDLLLNYGASLTVCDKKNYEDLKELIDKYQGKDINFSLGDDYLKNLGGDIIFKGPGIRCDKPEILAAKEKGSIITSEMEVFFSLCPCRIIAVTGSEGKTTTTTLISKFLEAQGFTCHLGGNIGKPLLPEVLNINPDDFAVVELSSFQLHTMEQSPYIAAITNVTPNHLDWHTSMDEYVQSKQNIFKYQRVGASRLTLNADNITTFSFAKEAKGEVNFFSMKTRVVGTYMDSAGDIYHSDGSADVNDDKFIMNKSNILLVGDHHIENYMTAISATWGLVDISNIIKIANTFGGVEHRTEFVREYEGVKFYNDAIATTPTRTIACLKSQPKKIILIVGGYDKKIPYGPLGPYINDNVCCLICMGTTGPKIEEAVKEAENYDEKALNILHVDNLEDAVLLAYKNANSGESVYLSPASASFDLYSNFEAKGNHFKEIVNSLELLLQKEKD